MIDSFQTGARTQLVEQKISVGICDKTLDLMMMMNTWMLMTVVMMVYFLEPDFFHVVHNMISLCGMSSDRCWIYLDAFFHFIVKYFVCLDLSIDPRKHLPLSLAEGPTY
jgi:hypothetical protein